MTVDYEMGGERTRKMRGKIGGGEVHDELGKEVDRCEMRRER